MNDQISRQSVVDMLDETKRIARKNIDGAVLMTFERVLDSLVNITNALPAIQPDIVKCKDCDFWAKQEDSLQSRCGLFQIYPTGGWFCGSAKRREETT